jgi:Ca2+-binding RTX toxin-like protein
MKVATKIKITGAFDGPDFVKGLADQTAQYTIVNSTTATLTFVGGFDPTTTYTQTLTGTGFGVTEDGRFTGTVTGFVGVNENLGSYWTFSNLDVPLNIVSTTASGGLSFLDLLVSPTTYDFIGDSFDDVFLLGSFDDVAKGRGGDDSFDGLSGKDTLFGNGGDDSLSGDPGDDTLYGGKGADSVLGDDGADTLRGQEGDDTIAGGGDDDDIFGDDGRDGLSGEGGSDTIRGGDDRDAIDGGTGADLIYGGKGGDQIDGGLHGDTLKGGKGDDALNAGPVDDDAGDNMFGGTGDDVLTGQEGVDLLKGGKGADSLSGGNNLDKLDGGEGDDVLAGGGSSDQIVGGRGNDSLSGDETGAVVYDNGLDTFLFFGEFGNDIVTDFHIGFDTIAFTGGIDESDVTVKIKGDDVKIVVEHLGKQSILVKGVADQFDPDIDIFYA